LLTEWEADDLTAQCLIFFFAGFDTISNLMTFVAYELAMNPDIQERLRQEVDEVQEELNGKPLKYEILQGMKYLDCVISGRLTLD
jgi:cytochrome P450 family 9